MSADLAAAVVGRVTYRPLPPATLGKNSHEPWYVKRRAWRSAVDDAGWQLKDYVGTRTQPYVALTVQCEWRQCGVVADPDAIIARAVSPVMDAAQAVGLIVDDANVTISPPERVRVAHRTDERCIVTLVCIREIGEAA